MKNLFKWYCDKVYLSFICHNSKAESELISEKEIEDEVFTILNSHKFNSLKCIWMSRKEKEILKGKIKQVNKMSYQKLVERKKVLWQSLVMSMNGKIKVIKP